MIRPNCTLALVLAFAGAAACARQSPEVEPKTKPVSDVAIEVEQPVGGAPTTVHYPIIANPNHYDRQCTVAEWTNERVHVKHKNRVTFMMKNNCDSPSDMGIIDSDQLFEEGSRTVTVPAHGMVMFTLTVKADARDGPHKSGVKLNTLTFDPDWEVEPGTA